MQSYFSQSFLLEIKTMKKLCKLIGHLRLCMIIGSEWNTLPTPCPTKRSTTPKPYFSACSLRNVSKEKKMLKKYILKIESSINTQ